MNTNVNKGNVSKQSYNIHIYIYTGRFIKFSVITNIYNKKTKGPTLMELFTVTGKLKNIFLTTRGVRRVRHP
jgi:hypothetical protein